MKLNKLLLFAAGGIVAYKVLSRVKIVKVDVPDELPREFILEPEVIGEVYGKEFAKKFEKEIKNAESKTYANLTDKIVELAKEQPFSIHHASDEAAKLIREYKEVSE